SAICLPQRNPRLPAEQACVYTTSCSWLQPCFLQAPISSQPVPTPLTPSYQRLRNPPTAFACLLVL
ncbi:hypothetical protein L916_14863, partial [Phytophthora nicotianae]